MQIHPVSIEDFKKTYLIGEKSPFSTDLFDDFDIELLKRQAGIVSADDHISMIVKHSSLLTTHPLQLAKNLPTIFQTIMRKVRVYRQIKSNTLSVLDTYPFSDYSLKANIIAAWKPKAVLEIGTGHGWLITSVKALIPKAECITLELNQTNDNGIVVKMKNEQKK